MQNQVSKHRRKSDATALRVTAEISDLSVRPNLLLSMNFHWPQRNLVRSCCVNVLEQVGIMISLT